jgi:hypothetical protein
LGWASHEDGTGHSQDNADQEGDASDWDWQNVPAVVTPIYFRLLGVIPSALDQCHSEFKYETEGERGNCP